MLDPGDELRELRDITRRLEAALAALDPGDPDNQADIVGVTATIAAYPVAVGQYVAVQPQVVTGPDVEGSALTMATDPAAVKILCLCLGPNLPVVGSPVLISTSPEGRYVFNF